MSEEAEQTVLKWLSEFEPADVQGSVLSENIAYLEKTIERLEGLALKANSDSKTAPTSRARGIARDTEKTTNGVINGIKFGIAFLLYGKEEDLNEDHLS